MSRLFQFQLFQLIFWQFHYSLLLYITIYILISYKDYIGNWPPRFLTGTFGTGTDRSWLLCFSTRPFVMASLYHQQAFSFAEICLFSLSDKASLYQKSYVLYMLLCHEWERCQLATAKKMPFFLLIHLSALQNLFFLYSVFSSLCGKITKNSGKINQNIFFLMKKTLFFHFYNCFIEKNAIFATIL